MNDGLLSHVLVALKIKSSTQTYSQNFNPNWFFIFYKEFYENNIFDFEPYLNNNDIMLFDSQYRIAHHRFNNIQIIIVRDYQQNH